MKLFPTKFIVRHQAKLLFLVFWGYVTILDLFYVTYAGPVFFVDKSIQPFTLFIHLSVATLTLVFYFLLISMMTRFMNKYMHKQPILNSLASDNGSDNYPDKSSSNESFK